MSNGVKPGERRGGRQRGTPNKATRERAILAEQILTEQRKRGKKLAREVLSDFMELFAGMAAAYQPIAPGMENSPLPAGRRPDEERFLIYAKLAVDTAKELAAYESPKLKAVGISQTPLAPLERPGQTETPLSPLQAYRLLRDADVIDLSPRRAPRE